jgi:hypothetical protein
MLPKIAKLGLLPVCLFPHQALAEDDQSKEPRVSWVSPQPRRSTWDIVWTCFLVYLFCTYYLVHLNLPRITESEATWHSVSLPLPAFAKGQRLCISFWPSLPLWRKWARRACWMLVAIVVPEFTISIAAKEYFDAWKEVKKAHAIHPVQGREAWSKSHQFFADMGGFLVKMPLVQPQGQTDGDGSGSGTTGSGDGNGDGTGSTPVQPQPQPDMIVQRIESAPAIPSTLHFEAREISAYEDITIDDDASTLNEEKITPVPDTPPDTEPTSEQSPPFIEPAYRGAFLSLDQLANLKSIQPSLHIPLTTILDRSKTSPLPILILLVQCISLLISSLARAATPGLTISQLELTTLTFLFPCLLGWFFWRHKPFSPNTHIIIGSPTVNIFNNAATFYIEHGVQLKPSSELEKTRRGELLNDDLFVELLLETIEEPRSRNSSSFAASLALYILAGLIAAGQLAAWNWDFPSHGARLAWRVCGLACLGCVIIPVVARFPRWISLMPCLPGRLNETLVDWTAGLVMFYMCIAAGVYVVARLVMFGLALYCLRSLPEGAYTDVDWTRYLVHFS